MRCEEEEGRGGGEKRREEFGCLHRVKMKRERL